MSIYPTVRPSLTLDFQKSKQLDPRISFSRSSTATYVEGGVVKYADEHQARFEDEGLLIEASRTNLLPESGNLNDQTYWNTSTNPGSLNQAGNQGWMVATSNTTEIVSPDGTNNAVKLSGLTTSTLDKFYAVNVVPKLGTISMSMNIVYSYTVWINDPSSLFNGVDNVFVLSHGSRYSNTNPRAAFNLANNTVTFSGDISSGPSGKVEDYPNGWKKLTASFASTTSDDSGPRYYLSELSNNTGGVTRFSANGEKFYAFGFQIEEGTFPSSYIPTSGSEVIRSADLASITGTNFSSWYNQSEGTVFEDVSPLNLNDGSSGFFNFISSDNSRWQAYIKNRPTQTNYQLSAPGNSPKTMITSNTVNVINKFAVTQSAASSDFALATNGQSVVSGIYNQPGTFTGIEITNANNKNTGGTINNNYQTQLNGHIARLSYYSERLTNEQLEAITS